MSDALVITIIRSSITDEGTHHEVEVQTGGEPSEDTIMGAILEGCKAAIGVAEQHFHPLIEVPSVTAEREQDFESGSEQEG